MKLWLSRFRLARRLRALQAPLDPEFVQSLRARLERQAQTQFTPKLSRFIGLSFFMQKRILRYGLALFFLAILGVTGAAQGLSAYTQFRVVQNVSAAYESAKQVQGIYHQATLNERLEKGVVTQSSVEEFWQNSATGEDLFVSRTPELGVALEDQTVLQATGTDRYGDFYAKWADPEDDLNKDVSMDQAEWFKTYAGPRYACRKSKISDGQIFESFLTLAPEDLTVHTVSGDSYVEGQEPSNFVADLMQSSERTQVEAVLKRWEGRDDDLDYVRVEQAGQVLHEFSYEQDGARQAYYFSDGDYRLVKTESTNLSDGVQERQSYLTVEVLPADQGASIFDFSGLGLNLVYSLGVGAPSYTVSDGCYDLDAQLMSPDDEQAFLQTVPESIRIEWAANLDGMIHATENRNHPAEGAANAVTFEVTNGGKDLSSSSGEEAAVDFSTPHDSAKGWALPTTGVLTMGFTSGHSGLDIANKKGTPVQAVLDGLVTYVGKGWDGGYGVNVWVNHGNGLQTHYVHLDEALVKQGDLVKKGQALGSMGNTGRVTGPDGVHLHFEVSLHEVKVDPMEFLR